MAYTYPHIRSVALITLVTIGAQLVTPIIQNTYADNTTYYVDASGGSDGNDGLSEGLAWQTLTNVNAGGFLPGDQILLKCGEGWSEQLIIQDSGTLGNSITFGSYGALCDGSNKPALNFTGGPQVSESGSVSYVTVQELDLSAGDSPSSVIEFSGNGTNITISGALLSNPSGNCINFTQANNISITGNDFSNCTSGVEIGNGSATVSGNTFSTMGSVGPAVSMSLTSSGSRTVSDNTFSGLGGGAIMFGQNATVEHNTITNSCLDFSDCAAITNTNQDIGNYGLDLAAIVNENFITTVGTGVTFNTYHQDGIRLDNLSRGVQVTGNTISGAQRAIAIKNGRFHTISNNTLYNPRTYAIHIMEDATSGSGEVVESNILSNNTILTYNPDYSMVRVEDTVNNVGTLATLSGNKFLNVYKPKLPVIEVLKTGGDSVQVDKDALTLVDATATNFTYFGYKTYTSTGSYSGGNLITNGTFGANITGWSTDVLTLSHNAGSGTLHAAQGVEATGVLTSNTFSIANGGLYEISGWIRNTTNSEGHDVKVRLTNSVGTLYGDREFNVVATNTGTTFKAYITANTTTIDAQLDFVLSNSSSDAEFDNIVVRQVTGLAYNSRNNEAVLAQNTSASSANISCASLGIPAPFCGQYVDYSNATIAWSLSLNPYASQIVFWNSATNILNRPVGSLVPSAGAIGNGETVTLTWNVTNSTSSRLAGSTYTGAFDYSVPTSGTMSLIPPNNGTNTYTFSATNDIGTTAYTADVVTSNTPPIVDPAYATGSEDSLSITGIVTSTDVNSGGVLSYTLFDAPLYGSIMSGLDGTGAFDYRPNSDFCGTDTFTFRAWDAYGLGNDTIGNPGVVTITVLCTNDTPVAIDDNLSGTGGNTGLLDVLPNDTDPDSPYEAQTFSITGLTQPSNGIVSVSGSFIEYTPDALYYGPDSFTYMIEDQSGALSNVATVNLTVAPGMNFPPEVSGNSYGVFEDSSVADFLSGSDLNNDTLTFSASLLPTNGVLSIVGSGFTYTPNANYYGPDSFTFFANDGQSDSSGATINLTVNAVEDIPMVTNDTVNIEMQTPSLIDVLLNDTDADNLSPTPANQGLTITGYTLPTNGDLTVVGNQFQYTGTSGYLGPDSFDYIVEDANGNISNTGTVTITVSTTNQFPVADSGSFMTAEDTLIANTLSGSDPDLTPVTFVLDSDVSNGVLSLSTTGAFTYTPDADYYGTDSFTFHVSDGILSSSTETVTIDITPVNDPPIANDDNVTGTEDMLSIFTPMDNDSDVDIGDSFSLHTIVSGPTHGISSISGSTIEYTPTADYCGADTIVYQIIDLSGSVSNGGTINIDVTCTNDAPTLTGSSYSILGNIPTSSGNILTASLTGVDIDGDTLSYTVNSGASNGVLIVSGTGWMTYAPNIGFSGSDSFTYSIDDGSLSAGPATVIITVNPNGLNLAPTANNDSFATNEDTPLSNIVTGSDPELAPLTFILDTNVTHGMLNLQSSGSFTYTPSANYHGIDSFTFYVSDGTNISATGTITLTVNSINDGPIANNDTVNGTEDTTLNITPLANDTDVDIGDILSLSGFTQGTHGTVVASGSTMLVYTPIANYCGADSISYQIQDQSGALSNTGTITINLTCVNDLPVANNDTTAAGIEDTPLSIAVLTNDTDIEDGTPISIANLTQPSVGGTVGIVGINIVFSPTANYCGGAPITFTYQARDGASALSNVATVTIPSVTCVNDIPVTQNASYTMTGNIVISSGTIDGSGNLIGYAATNHILTGIILATDVEGSPLSFTLATLPSSGTASLSSTGYFSYIPAFDYVGSMSFTVRSNDGTANSNPATISICVISPNPNVARPSCAPVLSVSTPAPNVGPGGGGGGGSSAASNIASNYSTVVSNGTPNELTSQLYLTRNRLSETTSTGIHTGTNSNIMNITTAPVSTLMEAITTIVDTAKITSLSTREGAPKIRQFGKTILSRIVSSTSLSQEEQVTEIETHTTTLETLTESATTNREILSLKYILRVFYAKRARLLMEIDFFNSLVSE